MMKYAAAAAGLIWLYHWTAHMATQEIAIGVTTLTAATIVIIFGVSQS